MSLVFFKNDPELGSFIFTLEDRFWLVGCNINSVGFCHILEIWTILRPRAQVFRCCKSFVSCVSIYIELYYVHNYYCTDL